MLQHERGKKSLKAMNRDKAGTKISESLLPSARIFPRLLMVILKWARVNGALVPPSRITTLASIKTRNLQYFIRTNVKRL